MKSTGGRLGRQEKAKRGNLWDWIESKTDRLKPLTLVGKGQLTFTAHRGGVWGTS